MLCLAAEELILGPLGELGPLDQQYDQTQRADFPLNASHVEALALALIEFGTAKDLIEMAGPSPTTRAAEQKVMEEIPVKKERAGLPRNRAKRKQTARKGDAHGRTAA